MNIVILSVKSVNHISKLKWDLLIIDEAHEGIDTYRADGADIQSKVLAFAFSLASEIERQLISDRTRESLKRVRAEGKHIGRPKGSTYRKLAKKHNKIVELLEKKVSKAEIARLLDCDWNTLHRYIQECIIDKSKIA